MQYNYDHAPGLCRRACYASSDSRKRVCISIQAPPALSNILAEIEIFIENLFTPPAAHHAEPTASAAAAAAAEPSPVDTQSPQVTPSGNPFTATSTNGAPLTVETAPPPERTVYLQPQTIERTVVQSAPLPDDLVHTSLLAELLAAFESKINAKIAAITTPPPFPQQVAAGGNGVFSYGAAAAASSGGRWRLGRRIVERSQHHGRVGNPVRTLRDRPPHRQHHHGDQPNLANATVTTLHVTGPTTLDTPLTAASGGTGISTAPTYGQLLMGQSNGTYALVSTSSLGIPGGTGAWGAITGTLSNQSDLQNALNAKLSLAQWYATTTSALAEGSNLYFTNARADARINATSSIGTLTRGAKPRERRHRYERHVECGRHRHSLRRYGSLDCPQLRSAALRPVERHLRARLHLLTRHLRRRFLCLFHPALGYQHLLGC